MAYYFFCGLDASLLQGYSQCFIKDSLTVHQYPFILIGGERHGESKMSGSRAQYNDLAKSWTRNLLMWSPVHQPLGNCFFPKKNYREVIVYPRLWNNTWQIREQSIYAINEH